MPLLGCAYSEADADLEDGGTADSGDPEFDSCYAQLAPNCVANEMDTAELMETPCKSLTSIPIPLTDGTTHGPVTLEGGPYGGKIEEQPERVIDLTLAWWDWWLKGDKEAKKMFVGDDCGLCNTPDELEYGHNSLLQ